MILQGRLYEIAAGIAGLPLDKVRQYRELFARQGYELPPEPTSQTIQQSIKRPFRKEKVGTALRNRVENLLKAVPKKSCACADLATKMDGWGIQGCEANREIIVSHMVANRDVLIEGLSEWLPAVCTAVVEIIPDAILRQGANWLLNKAIEDVKNEIQNSAVFTKKIFDRHRKPSGSNRHTKGSIRSLSLTVEQKQLFKQTLSASKPQADPISNATVHFGAHLWPCADTWKWHVSYWNELADKINGRCIVGIVTDTNTADIEEVRNALSPKFEIFVSDNTPDGENPTFRTIQSMMPTGNNDVMIYAHGKGVRPHTASSPAVKLWTELMYETVVFNFDKAVRKLSEGYKCFGSFRTFGPFPLQVKNKWHYSGTFFVVRSKYLLNAPVKNGYGGVEVWPGDHFKPYECWNEFNDNSKLKCGYDINCLYPAIVDAQMQWEVNRLGGPRCEQHKRELDWFFDVIHNTYGEYIHRYGMTFPVRVLVIGSRNGGLEYQLQKHGHETVSIDIAPQSDNTTKNLITGSSADPEVQQKAREAGPYDIVFIDGDHSYIGAKSDWEFALTLKPRIIAFHDIATAIKHSSEGCEVDRLWNEIKTDGHKTTEKVVGCGWGGIGVVFV